MAIENSTEGQKGSQKTGVGSQKKNARPLKSSQKDGESSQKTRCGSQKSSQKIIALISDDAMIGTEELARRLGITRRAVAKAISNLKSSGRLRRVGPDKGGHWEVMRYNV